MSVGDGSGLSPSCCFEGVGGLCLLVTQWSVSLLLCRLYVIFFSGVHGSS